jgi:hypothetical protein
MWGIAHVPPVLSFSLVILSPPSPPTPPTPCSTSHAFLENFEERISLTFALDVTHEVKLLPILLQHITGLHREAAFRLKRFALPEITTNPEEIGQVLANPRRRHWGIHHSCPKNSSIAPSSSSSDNFSPLRGISDREPDVATYCASMAAPLPATDKSLVPFFKRIGSPPNTLQGKDSPILAGDESRRTW